MSSHADSLNTMGSGGTLYDEAFILRMPPPYSPAQIRVYLEAIKWPVHTLEPQDFDANFENLKSLMFLHIAAFPFSNVDLH